MYVNLDQLPAGHHMYTIAVTDQPAAETEHGAEIDEVDVVAPARATVAQIIAAADLEGYEHCRVIGIIDQSRGITVALKLQGDLR